MPTTKKVTRIKSGQHYKVVSTIDDDFKKGQIVRAEETGTCCYVTVLVTGEKEILNLSDTNVSHFKGKVPDAKKPKPVDMKKELAKPVFTKSQLGKIIKDEQLLKARVEQGVKYLDKVAGKDWVFSIDISRLNLQKASVCVTGQLFEGFYNFSELSGLEPNGKEVIDYGFFLPNDKMYLKIGEGAVIERYMTLTRLWADKIRALQTKRID
jgi:hypothetical protein